MEVTRRDLAILGAFTVFLVLGGFLFVKSQGGAPREAAELPDTRRTAEQGDQPELQITESATPEAEPDMLTSSLAPGEVPANYQGIVERKLFAPLVNVQSKPQAGPARIEPLPIPSPAIGKQTAVKPTASQTASKPEVKPASTPSTPSTPAAPPKPPLAVTGLVRAGDGYRVIVENTELKRSTVVRVGEEAFGYRINEVSAETGEVMIGKSDSVGGSDVTLKLGENKKVEVEQVKTEDKGQTNTSEADRARSNSSSGSNGFSGSPGNFGGFDPSRLSPEQRARFEEYRRRRGDRGGGDGGGGGGGDGRGR